MRWIFVIAVVFAAGLAAGILFRGQGPDPVPQPTRMGPPPQTQPTDRDLVSAGNFVSLARDYTANFAGFIAVVEDLGATRQLDAIDAWDEVHGAGFDSLMRRARLLESEGQWEDVVDSLIDASLEVDGLEEQARLEVRLDAVTAAASKDLVAASRTGDLDALLEKITLALPEQARYFLELGVLRTRAGDYPGALAVLSQIQQHPTFGERARRLLADAEAARAPTVGSTRVLPLRQRGDQFVVEATLDGSSRVALLIDTGASMTVVSERVMASLGYPLDGPRAWFSTAGGAVEAPVLTVDSLTLGESRVRQLAVGVLPVDFPEGIDGLLGMNFLRHFEFRIDQEAAELELDGVGR